MGDIFDYSVNRAMLETSTSRGHIDWKSVLRLMPIPNAVSSNPILLSALNSLIDNGRIDGQLALIYNEPDINAIFSLANMVKVSVR